MKKIIILFFYQALAFSCKDYPQNNHIVKIESSDLINAITQYVEQNHIDCSKKVISILISRNGTLYSITSENTDIYKSENLPTYYSLINDKIMVFIYTGAEQSFSLRFKQAYINEIQLTLREANVSLQQYRLGKTYSAPVWKLTTCEDNVLLEKIPNPLELVDVPCEYQILQDSSKFDSLFLKKDS